MGTSVEQIDKTYGHLLPTRGMKRSLDAFDEGLGILWTLATSLTPTTRRENPLLAGLFLIGAPRFELGTSSPPD